MVSMEIISVTAELLGVNCYAVASDAPAAADGTRPCLLVDAGHDAAPQLAATLLERQWRPVAILLTHGHLDHVLGLPSYLGRWAVDAHLAAPDVPRLDDPAAGLSAEFQSLVTPLLSDWEAPVVSEIDDGREFDLAGLDIVATLAPGHTEGSTLFDVRDPAAATGPDHVLFTGDVLFAGSVGRVDLPGGDAAAMQISLDHLLQREDVPVLPGHGPATQLAHEVRTNPFLLQRHL